MADSKRVGSGIYRAYFNRWADEPLVWSVDDGYQATEINVRDIELHKVVAKTKTDPSIPQHDQERPRTWIEVRFAKLEVIDDVAHFFHNPDWRKPRL